MPQIDGYKTYRTKTLKVDETHYTIRFAVSKDGQDYIIFVSNDQDKTQKKYHINKETADIFNHQHGEELEEGVKKIFYKDIADGRNSVSGISGV